MIDSSFDKELIVSNLLGANTLQELHEKEKILTNAKMIILSSHPIEGNLDYAHLKAIHHFLFSDVYDWAGKDRHDVNIVAEFGKGKTLFTAYDKLPQVSKILFNALNDEAYFIGQDIECFGKSAAVFMNGLNILHPFREGNGRVQRIFMQYLAKNAGYSLNFKNITEDEMIYASIEGARGNLPLMNEIFLKALK
jgi:cell filamentation protein